MISTWPKVGVELADLAPTDFVRGYYLSYGVEPHRLNALRTTVLYLIQVLHLLPN
jgi:hypothetical protein